MQASHPHFWGEVCQRFRAENPELYRSWFDELAPAQPRAGALAVEVPDEARLHYLRSRCADAFAQLASAMTGHLLSVAFERGADFEIGGDRTARPSATSEALNADYAFDEFVIGSQNRLAHAACRSVADEPGVHFNPLFIHGPSGLGKSHLLQAVCAEIRRLHPEMEVHYVSCETFVNDYVQAMAAREVERFREKYRMADALAIDDVQFLAGQESSHDEFFHTFNALYQNRRQIIVSADAAPREIPAFAERLVSRFNWGLVVPIAPPDQETRRAILQKKAQLRGYELPDGTLDSIAERIDANVRALEGALTKVAAQCRLNGGSATGADSAREILDDLCGPQPRQLQISDILEIVTNYYNIRLSEILGKKRTRSVVQPRHMGMYLARKLTHLSLEEIGGHFGGRDHSTVLHAERAVEGLRKHDQATEQAVAVLTQRLRSKRNG